MFYVSEFVTVFVIICWWSVHMLSNKSVVCGTKVMSKKWPPHYFENECYFLYPWDWKCAFQVLCCRSNSVCQLWKISTLHLMKVHFGVLGLLCFITYHFSLLKDFIILYIALILGACICQAHLQQQPGN